MNTKEEYDIYYSQLKDGDIFSWKLNPTNVFIKLNAEEYIPLTGKNRVAIYMHPSLRGSKVIKKEESNLSLTNLFYTVT